MVIKIHLHFFRVILKGLELFECHRGEPYITVNRNSFASLTRNNITISVTYYLKNTTGIIFSCCATLSLVSCRSFVLVSDVNNVC